MPGEVKNDGGEHDVAGPGVDIREEFLACAAHAAEEMEIENNARDAAYQDADDQQDIEVKILFHHYLNF